MKEEAMRKAKNTSGDVIKINITPPSDTFPWVRIFRYPYGLSGKKPFSIAEIDAKRKKGKEKVAKEIGEAIINGSKILSNWFK